MEGRTTQNIRLNLEPRILPIDRILLGLKVHIFDRKISAMYEVDMAWDDSSTLNHESDEFYGWGLRSRRGRNDEFRMVNSHPDYSTQAFYIHYSKFIIQA
jgi:hypothetical protein